MSEELVQVCVCWAVKSLATILSKPWVNKHTQTHTQRLICRGRSTMKRQDKQGVKQEKTLYCATVCCVCVDPLFLCDSSVSWPYLGSLTINRWVRNSLYQVSGGGGGSRWRRGKDGEKRLSSSSHTMIYLSIPHPVSLLSTHSLLSSSYFSSSLDWPTCLSSSEHFKFNLIFLANASFVSFFAPFI